MTGPDFNNNIVVEFRSRYGWQRPYKRLFTRFGDLKNSMHWNSYAYADRDGTEYATIWYCLNGQWIKLSVEDVRRARGRVGILELLVERAYGSANV